MSTEIPHPPVPIPDELLQVLSRLSSDYHFEDLHSPDPNIQLRIGRKYIYISRKDIPDPIGSTRYVIPLQIGRISIEGGAFSDLIIDNQEYANNTLRKLARDPLFRNIFENFGVNLTEDPDADLEERIQVIRENTSKKMAVKTFLIKASQNATQRSSLLYENIEGHTIDVPMRVISFLSVNDPQEYISTLGAGPCIIVTSYNPTSKEAGITHMDAFTNMNDVLTRLFTRVGTEKVKVFGGDMSSLNQLIELKYLLDRQGISVEEWDVLNSVKSIAINGSTGEHFDVIGKENSDLDSWTY